MTTWRKTRMWSECPCKTCPRAKEAKGKLLKCPLIEEGKSCKTYMEWFLKRWDEIEKWKKEKR
jgi:hypothetical protein